MADAFQRSAFQNNAFQGGGAITAQVLAELYGGNIFKVERAKKRRREDEPSIEVMVRAVSAEPEGKKALIAALPKRARVHYPDPQLVLVSDLVREMEAATRKVQADLQRIYHARVDDDDEDDMILLSL